MNLRADALWRGKEEWISIKGPCGELQGAVAEGRDGIATYN